jgi:isoquinoline 1-oxidoreductase alpha subunit
MATLTVNGVARTFEGDGATPLLWYLRDELHMTGTKFGCGMGLCGACTVHLDGAAVRSCTVPVSAAAGKTVTTIEGLDARGQHPLQRAWREMNVPQCGFCQAGQIMQAAALLKESPRPTDAQIDTLMTGNLCRCGCYTRIRAAIKQAAGAKEA